MISMRKVNNLPWLLDRFKMKHHRTLDSTLFSSVFMEKIPFIKRALYLSKCLCHCEHCVHVSMSW